MCGVAAQPAKGAQRANSQTTSLLHHTALPTKSDQLAVDVAGQRSRQLEWISLTTAE